MYKQIKEIYSANSEIIRGTLIHIALISLALICAYNSYKEIGTGLCGKHFLSKYVKAEIKDTFFLTTLMFTVLYFLCSAYRNRGKGLSLTFPQYCTVIILLAVMSNVLFFETALPATVVLNLSFLYLAAFLVVWFKVEKLVHVDHKELRRFLPPILYEYMEGAYSRNSNYLKENLTSLLIMVFVGLLGACALLLLFKKSTTAEQFADIAYISLFIGVVFKTYHLIRDRA